MALLEPTKISLRAARRRSDRDAGLGGADGLEMAIIPVDRSEKGPVGI